MRTERRLRYYCDHCKKSGGQKPAMAMHELSCTKNPDRVCRMCRLIDSEEVTATLTELMAALPDPLQHVKTDRWGTYTNYDTLSPLLAEAIPKLRELAQGCPACILAALRQKGILAYDEFFDFKAEIKAAFASAIKARQNSKDYWHD